MKKIALIVKDDKQAIQKANELEKLLKKKNISVLRIENISIDNNKAETSKAPNDLFCVIVLGGDGTFLSAVRWIKNLNIPILGVKFGEVGFLSETTEDNLFDTVSSVIDQKFDIDPRMRLNVQVLRDNKKIISETVLNDVVINKNALARLANINTYLNDKFLTKYKADGLIVSTPTGSTAYSLAAGGPVLHPSVSGIILTPICPFTLTNRPLIIPDNVIISLELEQKDSDIMLTFDGQVGCQINEKDTIIIKKSNYPVNMIKTTDNNYYDILKAKLRWSGSRL